MVVFIVTTALLLCLLMHGTQMATAWDDQDLFSYCPPSRCSKDGPEIRFPLQLESSNSSPSCGHRGATCAKLRCSGKDTILLHPFLGKSKVISVDYNNTLMKIIPFVEQNSSVCPIQDLTLPPDADRNCEMSTCDLGKLVGCSRELTPSASVAEFANYSYMFSSPYAFNFTDYFVGPIPCLSNTDHFTYLVFANLFVQILPLDCKATSNNSIPIPRAEGRSFKQMVEATFGFSKNTISLDQYSDRHDSISYSWRNCELLGQHCSFSSQRNQVFCKTNGSHVKVIAASSVACFIVLSVTVAVALYFSLKSKYNEEIHLKVEMFLRTHGTSKPTRYSFPEVKKITRRFKDRVGQGGFGSVYRGQLPNGVPVAVKILDNSTGEGEEFINEVATIGRIHHANIVRLLGFCSEGTRRALLYEFMPNASLERYIFLHDSNIDQEFLQPEKMLDIAIGIARGMEYLHQGCNQRILHFDIKPHNILLDYNFNPKISDFGLAKLCARDQSIVTLTAARGTMGYIAPELYSRNFGEISYKSDVYSFGMLVLEMVSGRRNSDPSIQNQNEVYLPEWIYERVITGQDLVLHRQITEDGKEIARQLVIVALWCIQWNPKNRPSMTKVVNMLTGRSQNLEIPPKPFVPSGSHPMP
ncbi:hypothetical protein ACP4OV_021893 [Aristida adscensionis]